MFNPNFQISAKIAQALIRIERAREQVQGLKITPTLLKNLRESAKLQSTHYSTMIEGNRLTQQQVEDVLLRTEHFKDRERDEKEVQGYYEALDQVSKWAEEKMQITEKHVQRLHALVIGDRRIKFTIYRDGQNVIRDTSTGNIVYMPPEAQDVPSLMKDLVEWLDTSKIEEIPDPIRAAIAHYQFATIHPYYDGNGRTARLLANLVLYLNGYSLNGIYSLEEYYAQRLDTYYTAISVGESHNYYFGRVEADITNWIEYFCEGIAVSFENVKKQAEKLAVSEEVEFFYAKQFDSRERKILQIFQPGDLVTTKDLEKIFNIKDRAASYLASSLVEKGFFKIENVSKKMRKYKIK